MKVNAVLKQKLNMCFISGIVMAMTDDFAVEMRLRRRFRMDNLRRRAERFVLNLFYFGKVLILRLYSSKRRHGPRSVRDCRRCCMLVPIMCFQN